MRRLLVAVALGLALTGCRAAESSAPPAQEPLSSAAPTAQASNDPPARDRPTVPRHLKLGEIDAPVVPLDLTGNTLVPPDDPQVLGWWGRRAGARRGVTLLVGHTVHTGGGELDDLEEVPIGARVTVSGIRYRVIGNEVIAKSTLARRAPRLFSQSGRPRLVVVTCEDYDPGTGEYDSNVVLTATQVR